MIQKHAFRLAGVLGIALAASPSAFAALWERTSPSPLTNSINLNWVANYEAFRLDQKQLNRILANTPEGEWWEAIEPAEIEIPHPSGGTQRFKIIETSIMSEELRAQIPVKTYQLRGVDDLTASGCLDIGVNGLHGYIVSAKGAWVIDPAWRGSMSDFAVFYRGDNLRTRQSSCTVIESLHKHEDHGDSGDGPGDTLRRYRLAMNATGEYTAFHGGVAGAQNAIVTSINRNNVVYRRDLAVQMELVRNNPYPDAATDPFTNNNGFTMLGQNQTVCDTTIGDANYDIGHVFSTGGGGIAGLGVLRITGQKGRGVTGSPAPIGDPFDIDYVAHEIGHQFGANHTFNSSAGSCAGGNRNAGTAYEVGSASTIMGYAGICPPEDVQPNSDDYFHLISINEITPIITARIWQTQATGNITPTVTVPGNVTIPQSTPYRLTATGADANGDALTYCWEQWDLGTATTSPAQYSTGPLVRSIDPLPTGTRWIPAFNKVRDNISDPWEKLANTNRTTNWRVTVRDNRAGGGGYAVGSRVVTVAGAPFQVTSPNTAVSWPGNSTQTITWNVGGGSVATNVNILLSTNSGNSYESGTATVLLANTPNDGSQSVTIPNTPTTTARIIVEPVGNIFYDLSDTNFTITAAPVAPVITSISPNTRQAGLGTFALTVNGSNFVNGAVVRWNGSNRTTGFVSSTQLTASIPATDIAFTGNATVTVFQNSQTSNSVNFTITPGVVTTVNPNAVQLIQGQLLGGTLASLNTVDSNRYIILSDENQPEAEVWISATSPIAQLNQLQVLMNAIATRNDLSVFVELLDHGTSGWEEVGFFISSLSSTNYTFTVPPAGNPTQYVRTSDRLMRVRVRWIPSSDLDSGDGWSQSLDRTVFTVQP